MNKRKSTMLFATKLFLIFLVSSVVFAVIYGGLLQWLSAQENDSVKWVYTIAVIIMQNGFLWIFTTNQSVRDVKWDELEVKRVERIREVRGREAEPEPFVYSDSKGFLAGLYTMVPTAVLILIYFLPGFVGGLAEAALRIMFIGFSQIYQLNDLFVPWIFLVCAAFTAIVIGLAYRNGKVQRQKTLTMIDVNKKKLDSK